MKIQFKSEADLAFFVKRDGGWNDHNKMFAQQFGLSVIEVTQDGNWWDIVGSDGGLEWTIDVENEGHYFNIIEE